MADIMSPEKRSALMSRIKAKNTGPENTLCQALRAKGVYHIRHPQDLPGRPDVVFRRAKVAVFVNGDFWHGWRFSRWQHKLTDWWRKKIGDTKKRDARKTARLRRAGWTVLTVWEHQIEKDVEFVVERILRARVRALEGTVKHG